jgi:hypothetical protein
MLDFSDLPFPGRANIQTFYGNTEVSGTSWQAWQKPRGMSFLQIIAIGGGGGGGRGAQAGGGGGTSAATSINTFCCNDLPDTIYINIGIGGNGATSTLSATAGINTFVTIYPESSSVLHRLTIVAGGGAGNNAVGTAFGSTGTAGAESLVSLAVLSGLSIGGPGKVSSNAISVAGQTGRQGNSNVVTTAASGTGTAATLTFATVTNQPYDIGQTITVSGVTPTGYNGTYVLTGVTATTVVYANTTTGAQTVAGNIYGQGRPLSINGVGTIAMGGTGGAAVPSTGNGTNGADIYGAVIGSGQSTIYPEQLGGVAGNTTTSNGGDGSNGLRVPGLLSFFAGTGGASSGSAGGVGGNGGSGSYGCGGGGGGGSFTGTGGNGGKGGDGLVIMVAW